VKQRFTRRFVFGVHAGLAVFGGLLLVWLGFLHPYNWVIMNGKTVFAGFFNPYLLITGAGLLAAAELHALWLLWRENRLHARRFAFAMHSVLAAFSGMLLLFLLTSSWMVEGLKHAYDYATMPQIPTAPSPVIWLFPLVMIVAFVPHGLWWRYHELLERALHQAYLAQTEKPKRGLAPVPEQLDAGLLSGADAANNLKAQKE
jgi:cytochrome bd-type quinol oxidase subunit 2